MCSKTVRQNTTLDLNKVREIVFQDIYKLLDSFNLEYTQDAENIFMKCPIHEGSDNPFGVSIALDKQVWRCWTRGCHDHYSCNIWGFIKGCLQTDSFSDALKYVCKLYDVNGASKNGTSSSNNDGDKPDADFSQLIRQIKGYRRTEKSSCEIEHVARPKTESCPSPYFIARGYEPETLRFFGVRETTSDTRGILRYRATIPIWGVDRSYCGWIARSTRDFIQPKYIFSKGIRKTDYLYNYYNATAGGSNSRGWKNDTLFLVEGQGDVWRLWECGVKNAVGLFGKDVSSQQRKLLLSSGATRLVVLTDNDQAGRESKIKIKRELGRLFKLVFPKMHTKDLGSMTCEQVDKNILQDLKGYY